MAKKDRMRAGVELASERLMGALSQLEETIPFGPSRVQMSESELKKNLQNAQGKTLMRFLEQLGPDNIRDILAAREENG